MFDVHIGSPVSPLDISGFHEPITIEARDLFPRGGRTDTTNGKTREKSSKTRRNEA
jgi:hypothetical protein